VSNILLLAKFHCKLLLNWANFDLSNQESGFWPSKDFFSIVFGLSSGFKPIQFPKLPQWQSCVHISLPSDASIEYQKKYKKNSTNQLKSSN